MPWVLPLCWKRRWIARRDCLLHIRYTSATVAVTVFCSGIRSRSSRCDLWTGWLLIMVCKATTALPIRDKGVSDALVSQRTETKSRASNWRVRWYRTRYFATHLQTSFVTVRKCDKLKLMGRLFPDFTVSGFYYTANILIKIYRWSDMHLLKGWVYVLNLKVPASQPATPLCLT
jgi:hypothetical protein